MTLGMFLGVSFDNSMLSVSIASPLSGTVFRIGLVQTVSGLRSADAVVALTWRVGGGAAGAVAYPTPTTWACDVTATEADLAETGVRATCLGQHVDLYGSVRYQAILAAETTIALVGGAGLTNVDGYASEWDSTEGALINFTATVGARPAIPELGTGLDGDGSNDVMTTVSTLGAAIGAGSLWTLMAAVNVDAFNSNAADIWLNEGVIANSLSHWGLVFKTDGYAYQYVYDTGRKTLQSATTIAVGSEHTFTSYRDGTNIGLRIDGGVPATMAAGVQAGLTNPLRVFKGGGAGACLDGKIRQLLVWDRTLSSLEQGQSREWIYERLDTLSTFSFAAFAQANLGTAQLPYPHYGWSLPILAGDSKPEGYTADDLVEYARLTGVVPLGSVRTLTYARVLAAVDLIVATKVVYPVAEIKLCFYDIPWSSPYGGAGEWPDPTDVSSADYLAEVAALALYYGQAATWLADANTDRGTAVEMGAALVDCERFTAAWYRSLPVFDDPPADPVAWDAAISARHAQTVAAIRVAFPALQVEFYNRGGSARRGFWAADQPETGYLYTPYFTFAEGYADLAFSVMLGEVGDLQRMRKIYGQTCDHADAVDPGQNVTPWIYFGCSFPFYAPWSYPDIDTVTYRYDYPLAYSWQLGKEFHQDAIRHSADADVLYMHDRAQCICSYPSIFTTAQGTAQRCLKHFAAYCAGALNVQEVPE